MMDMQKFEQYLADTIARLPECAMKEAMAYSLLAPGKRVRPKLLFAALEGYGLNPELGMPMAAAIEMVHTYSLIHDDLPAMDNDDMRRGRPTCHVAFGEDIALLAGDAMQSLAFETIADGYEPALAGELMGLLARKSGPSGMCYGQNLDLVADEKTSLEQLEAIELYKTGCLIQLPLCAAAILAGRGIEQLVWDKLGTALGLQFQVQDDLLEIISSADEMGKSLSDERNNKATALSFYSADQARELIVQYDQAIAHELSRLAVDPTSLEEIFKELARRNR